MSIGRPASLAFAKAVKSGENDRATDILLAAVRSESPAAARTLAQYGLHVRRDLRRLDKTGQGTHRVRVLENGTIRLSLVPPASLAQVTEWMLNGATDLARRARDHRVRRTRRFVTGESFPVMGVPFELRVLKRGARPSWNFEAQMIFVANRADLIGFYRHIGRHWLHQSGRAWLKVAGLPDTVALEVTHFRSGVKQTCLGAFTSPPPTIRLDWRMFQHAQADLDTLMAHEVAHARRWIGYGEWGHTPGWRETYTALIPDWEQRREAMWKRHETLWRGLWSR
jgi:predicted metal-dependent hydrolase